MICPYCKQEMEKGLIQFRDALYWADRKRPVPALPPVAGKWVRLGENHSAEAWLCPACRKVILEIKE